MPETSNPFQRFRIGQAADLQELQGLFDRMLAGCRTSQVNRALLVADGVLGITQDELRAAVLALTAQCPPGFKLACVAPSGETFESWARVEDVGLRDGVRTRVFFDEDNAVRWLGL